MQERTKKTMGTSINLFSLGPHTAKDTCRKKEVQNVKNYRAEMLWWYLTQTGFVFTFVAICLGTDLTPQGQTEVQYHMKNLNCCMLEAALR